MSVHGSPTPTPPAVSSPVRPSSSRAAWAPRYAGEDASYADNVAKLLSELDGIADRRARFRTVVVAHFPDGSGAVSHRGRAFRSLATALNS